MNSCIIYERERHMSQRLAHSLGGVRSTLKGPYARDASSFFLAERSFSKKQNTTRISFPEGLIAYVGKDRRIRWTRSIP